MGLFHPNLATPNSIQYFWGLQPSAEDDESCPNSDITDEAGSMNYAMRFGCLQVGWNWSRPEIRSVIEPSDPILHLSAFILPGLVVSFDKIIASSNTLFSKDIIL